MTKFPNFFPKYLALFLILIFATVQFILILRHKSPYISDSYFYKHMFYQMQGSSFEEAYEKIHSQVRLEKADQITRNMFTNIDAYRNSYAYFTKRPLYPFLAVILNRVFANDYLAFVTPVLISYLGVIVLTYYFSAQRFTPFFAAFATAVLVAFYPFLEWSTFFLTDVIGAFFWLLLLFFTYQYFKAQDKKWLIFYLLTFLLSFFNREQSLLVVPLFAMLYIFLVVFKSNQNIKKSVLKIFLISTALSLIYLAISSLFFQKSILDNITYIRNDFGLYSHSYSLNNNISYLLESLKNSHIALVQDVTRHHWWFVFTLLGIIGIAKTLLAKRPHILDLLLISSGFASYLMILWPFLSYRFLFPAIITIIYFATKFLLEYFTNTQPR